MQDLVSHFGVDGAARFLQLVASPYRKPIITLYALNDDFSPLFDLTGYFQAAQLTFTDENRTAMQADFTLANPDFIFDKYGGAQPDVLVENRILQYSKGFIDPETGEEYLLPAYTGRITDAMPTYDRGQDATISVTCLDLLKNLVKQKATSDNYQNMQANSIATDILQRYGKFSPSQIQLADLDYVFVDVQFPDYAIVDMLAALYDPVLFWLRCDEAGNIVTGPRLGSQMSSMNNVLGYPDATQPPPEDSVSYIIPDAPLIASIQPEWQDHTFVNQVRVLGEASAAIQQIGPVEALYNQADSSIEANDQRYIQIYYQQHDSSTNNVIAQNVYVKFNYSTDHELDTQPQTVILSPMNWASQNKNTVIQKSLGTAVLEWNDYTTYNPNDLVLYNDQYYACQATNSNDPPTDTNNWLLLPFTPETVGTPWGVPIGIGYAPNDFLYGVNITDSSGNQVGTVNIVSATSAELILQVSGIQYTGDSGEHHGGFDFNFEVYGQPLLSYAKTLTAIADYGAQTVTQEEAVDVFGDHQTYQPASNHEPFAMSVPIEVWVNGASLGIVTADSTNLSGYNNFKADYERGRIVLSDLSYRVFTEDDAAYHPFSTDGLAYSDDIQYDLTNIQIYPNVKVPLQVYQSSRNYNSMYVFGGLDVGQSYDIRLHFADPFSTQGWDGNNWRSQGNAWQNVFNVLCQGVAALQDFDIYTQAGGALRAFQTVLSGVTPDLNGNITLYFTANDPVSGLAYHPDSNPGTGPWSWNNPQPTNFVAIINAIEIMPPQGQGAEPYCVNCGGPLLGPIPATTLSAAASAGATSIQVVSTTGMAPGGQIQLDVTQAGAIAEEPIIKQVSGSTVTLTEPLGYNHASGAPVFVLPNILISYGFSPIQQIYGINNEEVDDPLIGTQSACQNVAQYFVNKSAWQRNTQKLRCASIPHLQPGDLIRFFNPKINMDFWGYCSKVIRNTQRSRVPTGSSWTFTDEDQYLLELLFARKRGLTS